MISVSHDTNKTLSIEICHRNKQNIIVSTCYILLAKIKQFKKERCACF